MAWDKGFNCRATAGFVTDGTNETYLRGSGIGGGSDDYPQTRNGVTFGCVVGTNCQPVDRDNTVERRFAGINQGLAGIAATIRVDLEAADTYDIRWTNGDTAVNYSAQQQHVQILDNTTVLYSYTKATGPAQDHYFDASGVDRTEAAWPGSNVATRQTFATTTFKIILSGSGDGYTPITHLFISRVAAISIPQDMRTYRNRRVT